MEKGYVILNRIADKRHTKYVAFRYMDYNGRPHYVHNLIDARRFNTREDAVYTANQYREKYGCLFNADVFDLETAYLLVCNDNDNRDKINDSTLQYVICHNTSRYGIEFYRGENPLGIYTRDLYKAIRYKYSKDAFELINNIEHNKNDYFVAEYENIKVYLQDPKRNVLPHVPDVSKKCRDDVWENELYLSSVMPMDRRYHDIYDEIIKPYTKEDVETTKEVSEAMYTHYESYSTRVTPRRVPDIEKVIFNDPATIVYWKDGTKTIVQCRDGEVFDPEKGLAIAIAKKALGNKHDYYEEFKKHVGRYEKQQRKNAVKKAATKKDGNKKCNKKQSKQ